MVDMPCPRWIIYIGFKFFYYLIINSKMVLSYANFIILEDGDAKQVVIFSPSLNRLIQLIISISRSHMITPFSISLAIVLSAKNKANLLLSANLYGCPFLSPIGSYWNMPRFPINIRTQILTNDLISMYLEKLGLELNNRTALLVNAFTNRT